MKALLFLVFGVFARPDAGGRLRRGCARTNAWRAQHEREILQEFSELLALPNLASDRPNIERNALAIRAMLEKRGLTTQAARVRRGAANRYR